MENMSPHVQTLEKLGLTSLQARTYITAVALQKATVGKIAATSEVARPDVYRVLASLEKLGLIRKIIAAPSTYEATPLKEGCELLLNRKKEEYIEAKQKSQILIEEFNAQKWAYKQGGPENFSLINSKELLLERFAATDAITKKSLDIIGDWVTLKSLLFGPLETYENYKKKRIKVRVITEKPNKQDKKQEKLCKQNNPLFEIRYLKGRVPIRAGIYDKKIAHMRVRTQLDYQMTPSLWSDNPEFLKIMVAYYEDLWTKAEKIQPDNQVNDFSAKTI